MWRTPRLVEEFSPTGLSASQRGTCPETPHLTRYQLDPRPVQRPVDLSYNSSYAVSFCIRRGNWTNQNEDQAT